MYFYFTVSEIPIMFCFIGLQSTVPSNWDIDAMRHKRLVVPVDPIRESAEYKKVENLFLETSGGGYTVDKVKL